MVQQGFVTIATGEERYYRMARTLLRSYRQTCAEPMRFALIADRENEFTKEFDDVVILECPSNSWMDKIKLLQYCPYDENIFIDADCTVYRDINFFWNLFCNADDFSCFGQALPMESTEGWFTSEAAQVYPIQFITHLHGICYFIRHGETVVAMDKVCRQIMDNYNLVRYRGFNGQLADEPVIALAMAILGLKPIDRQPDYYCFVPFATMLETNFYRKTVSFANPKDGFRRGCCIVHWGNLNTKKAQYRIDAQAIDCFEKGKMPALVQKMLFSGKWLLRIYQAKDKVTEIYKWIEWVFRRAWAKAFGKG